MSKFTCEVSALFRSPVCPSLHTIFLEYCDFVISFEVDKYESFVFDLFKNNLLFWVHAFSYSFKVSYQKQNKKHRRAAEFL